ncbi:hypothetical protein GCM10020295_17480 [Streptomyces cinereospinus]
MQDEVRFVAPVRLDQLRQGLDGVVQEGLDVVEQGGAPRLRVVVGRGQRRVPGFHLGTRLGGLLREHRGIAYVTRCPRATSSRITSRLGFTWPWAAMENMATWVMPATLCETMRLVQLIWGRAHAHRRGRPDREAGRPRTGRGRDGTGGGPVEAGGGRPDDVAAGPVAAPGNPGPAKALRWADRSVPARAGGTAPAPPGLLVGHGGQGLGNRNAVGGGGPLQLVAQLADQFFEPGAVGGGAEQVEVGPDDGGDVAVLAQVGQVAAGDVEITADRGTVGVQRDDRGADADQEVPFGEVQRVQRRRSVGEDGEPASGEVVQEGGAIPEGDGVLGG